MVFTGCSDDEVTAPPITPDETVIDIDGNVYHTVKIGTQVWMVENLRVTKFNDGGAIPLVEDNEAWSDLSTAGYCWYNNDQANFKAVYGALYNWHTVENDKLCPAGWHVASNDEWKTLIDYLGGEDVAGGKLKEFGTSHWLSPNAGATNSFNFSAVPGGGRYFDGTWWEVGGFANYWTSTSDPIPGDLNNHDETFAVNMNLHATDGGIYRDHNLKPCGFSIRCIKD